MSSFMMFLQLASVLCDESTDMTPVTAISSPLGIAVIAVVLIDVVFLYYMLLTQREDFKEKSNYVFLAHGSFFFAAFNINILGLGKGPLFMLGVMIAIVVLYYFLCSIPLAVTIITILNITTLFPIMNTIFLGPFIGDKAGAFLGGFIGLGIAIALAFFFPDFLMKVHNLFVVYIYTALLVSLLGLTSLVPLTASLESKPNALNMITSIILFVVIGVLVFMK
jgi:hypothetical protein